MSVSIGKPNAVAVIPPRAAELAARASAPAARRSPASASVWTRPIHGQWTYDTSNVVRDPVNLYLHGSLAQVNAAFQRAGWTKANPLNLTSKVEFALVAIPGWLERTAVSLWDKITGRHDHLTNAGLERDFVLGQLRAAGTVRKAEGFTASWCSMPQNHIQSTDHRIYDVDLG